MHWHVTSPLCAISPPSARRSFHIFGGTLNPYERPDIAHVTRLENDAMPRLRDEAGHAACTDSRSERMGFQAANRRRQSMSTRPENHGILPDHGLRPQTSHFASRNAPKVQWETIDFYG
jgi:hypothetical protein